MDFYDRVHAAPPMNSLHCNSFRRLHTLPFERKQWVVRGSESERADNLWARIVWPSKHQVKLEWNRRLRADSTQSFFLSLFFLSSRYLASNIDRPTFLYWISTQLYSHICMWIGRVWQKWNGSRRFRFSLCLISIGFAAASPYSGFCCGRLWKWKTIERILIRRAVSGQTDLRGTDEKTENWIQKKPIEGAFVPFQPLRWSEMRLPSAPRYNFTFWINHCLSSPFS